MKMKKVVAVVMALALALINPFTVSDAKAANYSAKASSYVDLVEEIEVPVAAEEEKNFSYTISKAQYVGYEIDMVQPVEFDVVVTNSAGVEVASDTISATDSGWEYDSSVGVYYNEFSCYHKAGGDYTVTLKFREDTTFSFWVFIQKQVATINLKSANITAGFKRKLTVSGASGKVTWKTSNKNVAVVASNGVVTAKKPGKCTITATTTDGQKLTCKVTVRSNVYQSTKATNANCVYGKYSGAAYKAYYNKNGDLVVKATVVNNYYYKVSQLRNVKIVAKNASGKVIGTYSLSKKNVSIPVGTYKDFTFTIKKSKLKIKKADLRNSTVSFAGTCYYYY